MLCLLLLTPSPASASPSAGPEPRTYSGKLDGTKQAHSTTARATPNVVDSGPSSCQGQPRSPVKTENAAGSYFVEYSTKTICFGDVASIAGHVKLQIRENNGLGFQWDDDSVEVVGHYPGTTSHWFYTAGQNHCSTVPTVRSGGRPGPTQADKHVLRIRDIRALSPSRASGQG
jgi:hypothetical protein